MNERPRGYWQTRRGSWQEITEYTWRGWKWLLTETRSGGTDAKGSLTQTRHERKDKRLTADQNWWSEWKEDADTETRMIGGLEKEQWQTTQWGILSECFRNWGNSDLLLILMESHGWSVDKRKQWLITLWEILRGCFRNCKNYDLLFSTYYVFPCCVSWFLIPFLLNLQTHETLKRVNKRASQSFDVTGH